MTTVWKWERFEAIYQPDTGCERCWSYRVGGEIKSRSLQGDRNRLAL